MFTATRFTSGDVAARSRAPASLFWHLPVSCAKPLRRKRPPDNYSLDIAKEIRVDDQIFLYRKCERGCCQEPCEVWNPHSVMCQVAEAMFKA